jgi:hypothetical protein
MGIEKNVSSSSGASERTGEYIKELSVPVVFAFNELLLRSSWTYFISETGSLEPKQTPMIRTPFSDIYP